MAHRYMCVDVRVCVCAKTIDSIRDRNSRRRRTDEREGETNNYAYNKHMDIDTSYEHIERNDVMVVSETSQVAWTEQIE